jgi:hypothetical protein
MINLHFSHITVQYEIDVGHGERENSRYKEVRKYGRDQVDGNRNSEEVMLLRSWKGG